MSQPRIAFLLLLFLFSAVTVSADIIPPSGRVKNRPSPRFYSSIQLTVGNVPKDMILILMGKKDELLQMARSDEMITVSGESTLYLAVKDKLSKPFTYGKDEKNLIKLKQYRKEDLPSSPGPPPGPVTSRCTVKSVGPQNYILVSR